MPYVDLLIPFFSKRESKFEIRTKIIHCNKSYTTGELKWKTKIPLTRDHMLALPVHLCKCFQITNCTTNQSAGNSKIHIKKKQLFVSQLFYLIYILLSLFFFYSRLHKSYNWDEYRSSYLIYWSICTYFHRVTLVLHVTIHTKDVCSVYLILFF